MGKAQFVELPIPPRIDLSALAGLLSDMLPRHAQCHLTRTFHDSFDWRLYRAGLVLETETDEAGNSRVICRHLEEEKLLAVARLGAPMPRFVWELEDPRLRALLDPELEMRALLPQAAMSCDGPTLASDDSDLRVHLATCAIPVVDGTSTGSLGQWLLMEATADGMARMAEVRRLLMERFALDSADAPLPLQALTTAGKRPGDPNPSLVLPLNPLQRSDTAAKALLLQLLETMEINEPGLMERLDSEFLHDFRVAVRRTRSALGQIKGVLPPRTTERFASGFAWLGQITGEPRDLDVYLLGFEDLRAQLPANLRPALEPLKSLLELKAERAYALLIRKLGSRRYRRLLNSWRKVLESAPARRPTAENAKVPIAELADRRILKVFRRALKQGMAIEDDSPDEQLHELRKTCKKLRYLLEFFQSLYPADKLRALIKDLKGFQNHLGDLQDLSSQIATIYNLGQEMRAMKNVSAETLLAMGALLGRLEERRRELRESFRDSFRDFSRAENHAH
ncbi:MAG: hypothetical protein H6R26_1945, partial [Proteobacteria bacterium]|nr:hypothetical protein [Pseudomonadota bacterium]